MFIQSLRAIAVLFLCVSSAHALDLSQATIVTQGDRAPLVAQTAATVLAEEVEKRTDLHLVEANTWPESGPVIALVTGSPRKLAGKKVPRVNIPETPEAFAIVTEDSIVWIVGTDGKGVLNGVGKLLRILKWEDGAIGLRQPVNLTTAPDDMIRGHQLGYRNTANSYDAWTPAQYDQYIRELTFFGINAIENIPLQDTDSPLMPVTRAVMNREMSKICHKYGLQYWVWTPATIDLTNAGLRAELLTDLEAFYKDCPYLDAVFFPGGDPGDNHPQEVMPFLEDVAMNLAKVHPNAKVWMSLQGFEGDAVEYFYDWINANQPDWFGGAVGGPSSPPLAEMRARIPARYPLRDYPDITHTVRSQYATKWIDPAFAFTSGREGTNPEPIYYSTVYRAVEPYTDGFITYSDGMHDDVNKTVWSLLGWDHDADIREGLIEYCNVFFGSEVAERAADGIFALERNWSGPLATNGGVEATLALWHALEAENYELMRSWRWHLCMLKAEYDAYTRARLILEEALEEEANTALMSASVVGAAKAMDAARAILSRTTGAYFAVIPCGMVYLPRADGLTERRDLRWWIDLRCRTLFGLIGYQTSVSWYGAKSPERGAVRDFLDYPLNNRRWYEDQFAEIEALPTEDERVARLERIAKWENPGPGSFYDDIGNVAQSDHVIRGEALSTDPHQLRDPNPDFMWWDNGDTRVRQSWMSKMDWPLGLRYAGLDPDARYTVRTTGRGQCLLRADGELVKPDLDGREVGEWKTFSVPAEHTADGELVLTFDKPDEPGINWRQASRLTEVWLLKAE